MSRRAASRRKRGPEPAARSAPARPLAPPDWTWHAAAVLIAALAPAIVLRGWLADTLPPNDFAGHVADVTYVRDALLRHGTLPTWFADRFAGSSSFIGRMRELLTFPLALAFGPLVGTKLMFVATKIVAMLGTYALFWRFLGAPAAGIVAGYAHAFGAPANHQSGLGGDLDVAFSGALFPLIVLASAELLHRRRLVAAVALGALVAVELSVHSHLQAMVCPLLFLMLLALRPWRRGPEEDDPIADPALARRWLVLAAAAVGVFLALAASPLAWLASDLSHHGLHTPETVAQGLERYIEQSPFMYVNRANWLGAWIEDHRPDAMPFDPDDSLSSERRYLGIVPLVVCVVGWFFARRDFSLRRWSQGFALLFLFQYWLAMGPRPLLWQLARAFDWSAATERTLRVLATGAALGCLGWAALRAARRRQRAAGGDARLELACGLALVLALAAQPLFDLVRFAVPLLRGMRSPGHFFDLAPFSFYVLFGVALVACERAVRAPAARRALLAGIALLVVLDFRPSIASFAHGSAMGPIRQVQATLARLPGEDGSLRIAMLPWYYSPPATLATAGAQAGTTWSWVDWQAGTHWRDYLQAVMSWTSPDLDATSRARTRPAGDVLGRIARLKYFLDQGAPPLPLPAPWRRVMANEDFALWEQPTVEPMAVGYRSYAVLARGGMEMQAAAVAAARRSDLLGVAGETRLDALEPAAVLDLDQPAWAEMLAGLSSPPLFPVAYRRPAPDHIVLETDAGSDPAALFVSEAHHPWWRASVDGRAARVVRAQITFMALGVESGRHVVDLRFRPPLVVRAADILSAAAWIALGVGLAAWAVGWLAALRPR